MDQHKKVRKALVRTIKTQYDCWLIQESKDKAPNSALDMIAEKQISPTSESETEAIQNREHIFSEFTFKIGHGQAIVRFKVDQKIVSAFFEEKDDQWKLVCAAFIPPAL
jgi:hypothetical protein